MWQLFSAILEQGRLHDSVDVSTHTRAASVEHYSFYCSVLCCTLLFFPWEEAGSGSEVWGFRGGDDPLAGK